VTITLVVAIAEDGVIGRDGGLPWRLSTDMKRFKAITMGHPVVMGRKTWESFPRPGPLPGRTNIVITRDADYRPEGAVVTSSVEDALEAAEKAPGGDLICVIGGGQVFAEVLGRADRLDVTHVLAQVDGDVRFPPIDPRIWRAVSEEAVPAGEKDDYPTRFVVYERRQRAV
jgi:dihydrofolate reductase